MNIFEDEKINRRKKKADAGLSTRYLSVSSFALAVLLCSLLLQYSTLTVF